MTDELIRLGIVAGAGTNPATEPADGPATEPGQRAGYEPGYRAGSGLNT